MLLFFIITGALALLLPPAVTAAHAQGWLSVIPSFLYETTWLVTIATAIIYVYLSRWAARGMFVQMYLLSMVVKLLAFFVYTLVMIMEDRAGAAFNVIYFMCVYFLFTALEIAFLYRRISGSTPS